MIGHNIKEQWKGNQSKNPENLSAGNMFAMICYCIPCKAEM